MGQSWPPLGLITLDHLDCWHLFLTRKRNHLLLPIPQRRGKYSISSAFTIGSRARACLLLIWSAWSLARHSARVPGPICSKICARNLTDFQAAAASRPLNMANQLLRRGGGRKSMHTARRDYKINRFCRCKSGQHAAAATCLPTNLSLAAQRRASYASGPLIKFTTRRERAGR